MKLTNAIKKAEQLARMAIVKDEHRYSVTYKGYIISFACNGRLDENSEATNYYTQKVGSKDEIETDYFSGTFHDNLSKAFKFVDIMAPKPKNELQVKLCGAIEGIFRSPEAWFKMHREDELRFDADNA